MEKELYNIFFDEKGIFCKARNGVDFNEQKEKAKKLLNEVNEKIGVKEASCLQIKVLFEIVAELAASSDKMEICDFFYDVQNNMNNVFLSVKEVDELKGE